MIETAWWQNPAFVSQRFFFCILFPVCVFQWKREQDFELQLLERAVQGEEAQVLRSVQGEERPPEHSERPRPHSDEWLTFCSTAISPPTHEVDLEPLDYDVDLKKEVSCICLSKEVHVMGWLSVPLSCWQTLVPSLHKPSGRICKSSAPSIALAHRAGICCPPAGQNVLLRRKNQLDKEQ